MSKTEVRVLNSNENALWDSLVERSSHGTIFHTSSWLKLCRDYHKYELKIIGCFLGDELAGGCPLFIRPMFKRIVKSSISHTSMMPFGGFVLDENGNSSIRKQEENRYLIIKAIDDYIHYNKLDSYTIEITNSPEFGDVRPLTWNGWRSSVSYTYYFDLRNDIDSVISRDIKKKINRSNEMNIEIRVEKNPKVHYLLYTKVFNQQNLKPLVTREFFENVISLIKYKDIGDMWIAETPEGETIASQIRLWDSKRAYAWSAASDPNFQKTGANAFLFHYVLNELKRREIKEINMMHANTQRLTQYITGYNPRLIPYYTIWKINPRYELVRQIKHAVIKPII